MYGLMTVLMEQYLVPLVQVLFASEPVAYGLDHHHSFIVQYQRSSVVPSVPSPVIPVPAPLANSTVAAAALLPPGDKGLDMHHDSSEVTVNICLGKEGFQGGGLRFCGLAGDSDYRKLQYTLQHVIGRAVVHLGRHRHGADDLLPPSVNVTTANNCPPAIGGDSTSAPAIASNSSIITTSSSSSTATSSSTNSITTSERLNLIMWLRSSAFRAAAAYGHINPDGFPRVPESSSSPPDICCLSKFNDPDYEKLLANHTNK